MKARLQRLAGRVGTLNGMILVAASPWRTRWQALDTRVQRMVLAGAALLALAMLWAYVWLPAARGRAMLDERLPVMSAQLAAMRIQAEEIRRINSLPPVVTSRSALPLADVAALQTLFGANAKVTLDENRAFRIVIPALAYTAWLDQLDSVLGRYRVRVAAINLKSLSVAETKTSEKAGGKTAPTPTAAPTAAPAKTPATALAAVPAATPYKVSKAPAEVAVELTLIDDSDRRP